MQLSSVADSALHSMQTGPSFDSYNFDKIEMTTVKYSVIRNKNIQTDTYYTDE